VDFDEAGPQVAIQIDRQSLRVFSQADIDAGRVQAGEESQNNGEEGNGQG
jgi:hypothetical protein